MKKTKLFIFSISLALLMFANIRVTLFEGNDTEISFNLNNMEVFAYEPPPEGYGWDGICTVGLWAIIGNDYI